MTKLTARVHTPSMLLALLSFGIMQPPSLRTVRCSAAMNAKASPRREAQAQSVG